MTKTEKKKLTLAELIDKKEQYLVKKEGTEELYLEQLNATVTIVQPDRQTVLDAFESESDEYLVYSMVTEPDLKDKDLQKAYGCAEPIDIVTKIFDPGTVAGIAKAGLKLAGFESNVTVVKNLKN
ncbi:phage tail assembly chaperone [Sporosarcina sp. FSL K6-1508]|uniref:phage tail assembly chaperone n=1 Tax=Sporosarcina sp. FSL K6-1508 TaxID=2921553 RepID=UPI0030F87D52